jgi:catechol 2,3-dioxygenase-like lactoylglutathione lyase family enzyme
MKLLPLALVFALVSPSYAQLAPMNEAGMTYGHVHINVSDLELHKRLWVEHFGGEVVQRGPITAVKVPNMLIVLTERAPTAGSNGSVVDHFGFKVRDIAMILARWRAAGYEVQSEFTGAEGFPNAYLMGPDSVRIELQQDTTLTRDAIGHHVHFNAPDAEAQLAWYVETFDVAPFQRGRLLTTANAPGINLSFSGADQPRAPTRGRAIDHIGFEYADLDAVYNRLLQRGIQFEGPPREVPEIGLKVLFLTDPWGARVELSQGLVDF